MHFLRQLLLPALLVLAPLCVRAGDPDAATGPEAASPASEQDRPKTFAERMQRQGVKTTEGPAKVALGKIAEYQLLPGQHFVGTDSIELFFKLTQNTPGGDEVGVVIDPSGWVLFFDYADVGYVKDDDKDKLDPAKLLASMRENEDASNERRRGKGWDEIKVQGWATAPHYDEKTHNLTWAVKLSSSQDNHQSVWINESIRLLGRGGYMNVTLVAGPEEYAAASQDAAKLLAGNFGYTQGQRYAEWKQGDKIAAVGLSALVLGGGAAAAAKLGLFGKLGALFAKLGKGIIVVVAAIGAGIMKLFRRLSGSHPSDSSSG